MSSALSLAKIIHSCKADPKVEVIFVVGENIDYDHDQFRGGLSKGLRGAIAQGHHKIGGTTLADFKMDILVAFFIFLKGTYICDPVILIYLP